MRFTANAHTITSLFVAFAVFVSGVHGKDLAIPITEPGVTQKQADDSQATAKIAHDLHHHSDNSIKIQHADGHQADNRSLRLLHQRKTQPLGNRIADRLRVWWQLNTLHVS